MVCGRHKEKQPQHTCHFIQNGILGMGTAGPSFSPSLPRLCLDIIWGWWPVTVPSSLQTATNSLAQAGVRSSVLAPHCEGHTGSPLKPFSQAWASFLLWGRGVGWELKAHQLFSPKIRLYLSWLTRPWIVSPGEGLTLQAFLLNIGLPAPLWDLFFLISWCLSWNF